MDKDRYFMQRALELASRAAGRTSPNPLVGAVVVKDGEIVGEGYHRKAGEPHAEVIALEAAGENSRNATLYVTLEPCNHYGRTPPCTEAVIRAGISTVYVAVPDPNPQVSGRGIARLREAGIQVNVGLLEEEARELNRFFFKYITRGLPFVALKTAMTIDGKIATRTGNSRWITNERSREYVHQLRNTYDAVLVGIGTVLADDPLLNTRLPQADTRDPVRLIIDARLEMPLGSRILQTARQQETIVYCLNGADSMRMRQFQDLGAEVVVLESSSGRVPLKEVFRDVAQRGLVSVLMEAGSQINACALENGLVDKVYWFIAPRICGGDQAPSPVGGRGIDLMSEAIKLHNVTVRSFDGDLLVEGFINNE